MKELSWCWSCCLLVVWELVLLRFHFLINYIKLYRVLRLSFLINYSKLYRVQRLWRCQLAEEHLESMSNEVVNYRVRRAFYLEGKETHFSENPSTGCSLWMVLNCIFPAAFYIHWYWFHCFEVCDSPNLEYESYLEEIAKRDPVY